MEFNRREYVPSSGPGSFNHVGGEEGHQTIIFVHVPNPIANRSPLHTNSRPQTVCPEAERLSALRALTALARNGHTVRAAIVAAPGAVPAAAALLRHSTAPQSTNAPTAVAAARLLYTLAFAEPLASSLPVREDPASSSRVSSSGTAPAFLPAGHAAPISRDPAKAGRRPAWLRAPSSPAADSPTAAAKAAAAAKAMAADAEAAAARALRAALTAVAPGCLRRAAGVLATAAAETAAAGLASAAAGGGPVARGPESPPELWWPAPAPTQMVRWRRGRW
jgi:hypothetical protein